MLAIAASLALVFFIATQVHPYDDDGTPLKMASHQSLGLPACNFRSLFNLPCPSCGMTTSFSLFIRGDLVNSVRANFVGTLLAAGCFLFVPWGLASAFRARYPNSLLLRQAPWPGGFKR